MTNPAMPTKPATTFHGLSIEMFISLSNIFILSETSAIYNHVNSFIRKNEFSFIIWNIVKTFIVPLSFSLLGLFLFIYVAVSESGCTKLEKHVTYIRENNTCTLMTQDNKVWCQVTTFGENDCHGPKTYYDIKGHDIFLSGRSTKCGYAQCDNRYKLWTIFLLTAFTSCSFLWFYHMFSVYSLECKNDKLIEMESEV